LAHTDLAILTDKDLQRGLKQRALKDFERALDTGKVTIDSLPPKVAVAHYKLKNLELRAEAQRDSVKSTLMAESDDVAKARVALADALHESDVALSPASDPIQRAMRRDSGDVPKHLFSSSTLEKVADDVLSESPGGQKMVAPKVIRKWGARRAAGLAKRPADEAAQVATARQSAGAKATAHDHMVSKLKSELDTFLKGAGKSKSGGKGKTITGILGGLMAVGAADRLNRN
jgi:hypothetical protein